MLSENFLFSPNFCYVWCYEQPKKDKTIKNLNQTIKVKWSDSLDKKPFLYHTWLKTLGVRITARQICQ